MFPLNFTWYLVSWHLVDATCTRKDGPRLWLEYRWNTLGNRMIGVNWPQFFTLYWQGILAHLLTLSLPIYLALLNGMWTDVTYTVLSLGLWRGSVTPLALSHFCQIPERHFPWVEVSCLSFQAQNNTFGAELPREVRLDLQLEAKPPRHNKLNQPSSVIDPWKQVIAVLSHWVWGFFLHSIV